MITKKASKKLHCICTANAKYIEDMKRVREKFQFGHS